MQLGFATAILPDQPFEEVLSLAAAEGYDCVEVMCWPVGKAERRYAGVTHIDVNALSKKEVDAIHELCETYGLEISSLGYYPNPLDPDPAVSKAAVSHIKRVIAASAKLSVGRMTTFVGRDWTKSVDANWARFRKVWKPLVKFASDRGVKIGIENCPMLFTNDEWPGGKNLATSPAIWRRMFDEIPDENFGLNYDPSHMIWQQMDEIAPIREFAGRLHHVHAKDVRLDREILNDVGIMATPNTYHTPKLPGMGDVRWGKFFSALTDTGYDGPVCVEVEDRAYEGSLDKRQQSLRQSFNFLRNYVPYED